MGRFQLTPEAGQQYSAFVRKQDGSVTGYAFPEVRKTGYTMLTDNLSDPSKIKIFIYANIPGREETPVQMIAHSRSVAVGTAKGIIKSRGLAIQVPTAGLPEGILHLTLFSNDGKPVSERLVFIDHGQRLRVQVSPARSVFSPREKAEIEIMVTDASGKPAQAAHVSVAVTSAGRVVLPPDAQHIGSYLLLASDLKGYIERPSCYFDPALSERRIHLDYLMGTQGWTRFRWNEVLQDTVRAPSRQPEKGITLAGFVRHSRRKPVSGIPLSLYFTGDSLYSLLTAETDANGHFALHNLVFSARWKSGCKE